MYQGHLNITDQICRLTQHLGLFIPLWLSDGWFEVFWCVNNAQHVLIEYGIWWVVQSSNLNLCRELLNSSTWISHYHTHIYMHIVVSIDTCYWSKTRSTSWWSHVWSSLVRPWRYITCFYDNRHSLHQIFFV